MPALTSQAEVTQESTRDVSNGAIQGPRPSTLPAREDRTEKRKETEERDYSVRQKSSRHGEERQLQA